MTFSVTVLGNNAALPAQGRHPTALVVNHNDQFYLLDCGEGTQSRLLDLKVRPGRLHTIFISHLHGDHYFGLIGLLTTFHLNRRELPLTIVCPKGLQEIINLQLKYSGTVLSYQLHFIEADTTSNKKVFENNSLEVFSIPMTHRIPTCGYLFREKPGLRKINVAETSRYEVPFQYFNDLKNGLDYVNAKGETIENKRLTFDADVSRVFGFCSDTIYTENYIDIVREADMIYHESTFLQEDTDRAAERFHCTSIQAATIAKKAGIKKLLLGHFSAKYAGTEVFGEEARTVFPNAIATVEGETYNVRG